MLLEAISMQDITGALKIKKAMSEEEVRNNLPPEIQNFPSLFVDNDLITDVALPPHRSAPDTRIKMKERRQGQDKEAA